MNDVLDDLPRRLADLADSAGPWDDPMPEVRRRAVQAGKDSESRRPGPAALRAKNRWLRPVDPFTIVSAAAVVLVVVALGWLIHGSGTGGSNKSASDAQASVSGGVSHAAGATTASGSAAATAGPRPRTVVPSASSAPAPAPVRGCGVPDGSSALSLQAPATVRTGGALSVKVRQSGRLAGSVRSQVVVAVADGRVVGRLVPTGTKVGPGSVPAADAVLTGTLRASTCGQAIPKPGSSTAKTLPGKALPPGRYQLIVVVVSTRATTASAAVTVTVTP